MYTSLGEIMAGWRKNMFAGGRDAMPWGRLGQVIFPALLLLVPLLTLLPPLALAVARDRRRAALARARRRRSHSSPQLATWVLVYRWMDAPVPLRAALPVRRHRRSASSPSRRSRADPAWNGRDAPTLRRRPPRHRSR